MFASRYLSTNANDIIRLSKIDSHICLVVENKLTLNFQVRTPESMKIHPTLQKLTDILFPFLVETKFG